MDRAVTAFLRAIASLFHPKMLALLLVPFVVAIVFWGLVALIVWDPLIHGLQAMFFEGGVADWLYAQAERVGLEGLRDIVTVAIALMLVVPLMFVTALLIIALFAMPAVNRHLGGGPYRDVGRRGSWSIAASIWNATLATAVFLVGYLVTLPLWLIPPLGFVVPWLWWGWLTARLMRFDSLVEFTEREERRAAITRHRRSYFLLGMMVTALNYIPPLFLVTPVLSALAFGHYSLALLRDERAAVSLTSG
jgi:hypothetical protein